MAIEQFNHIKDVLDELDNQRPARFGYTEAAVNATGAAEIAALEGLFIIEDPTQINSIPTPDLVGMDPVIINIGLRTQAATISRMAVNHFFGRLGLVGHTGHSVYVDRLTVLVGFLGFPFG